MEDFDGRLYKLVDRYSVHGGARPLVERVSELIPADAQYVVFDLDRTVHLGVTIGEQLGWELVAALARGRKELEESFDDGFEERLEKMFSVARPLRSAANICVGLRAWGPPGLLYAATVRLGAKWPAWDDWLGTRFGADYVDRIQSLLRTVLMAYAADYTPGQLRAMATRAWRRYSPRLVVTPEVVDAIRAHCPRLRAILLSSASTKPTVEHAAEELGVDGYVSSSVDVVSEGGRMIYTSPAGLPAGLRPRAPRYFSRPGAVLHNASTNKVSFLRMRFPEVFDPEAVTVGISDNNHGEDRAWTDHFTHVIALNSRHPYSPIVSRGSPCRSIGVADAQPLDAAYLERRSNRWFGTLEGRTYDETSGLHDRLQGELGYLESLRSQLRDARETAAREVDETLRRKFASAAATLAELVERYNRSAESEKSAVAVELHSLARKARRMRAQIRRAGRDCSRLQHEIVRAHDAAGRSLAVRAA